MIVKLELCGLCRWSMVCGWCVFLKKKKIGKKKSNSLSEMFQQLLGLQRGGGMGGGQNQDNPLPDTSEKVQISSLSLLKMLKHGQKNRNCFSLSFSLF